MNRLQEGNFSPNIIYHGEEPVEYAVVPLTQYGPDYHSETFESVFRNAGDLYASKEILTRNPPEVFRSSKNRTDSPRNVIDKKLIPSTETNERLLTKKDKYKVYGELINTYGYGLEDGCKSFKALNYYTNEEITIPMDPAMTPGENSKKYFDRYGKLKRTEEALTEQIADTEAEIEHLESISNALDIARAENDLSQIKEELTEYGYIKKHYSNKKGQKAQAKIKNRSTTFPVMALIFM